jgi:hypothetical protein
VLQALAYTLLNSHKHSSGLLELLFPFYRWGKRLIISIILEVTQG